MRGGGRWLYCQYYESIDSRTIYTVYLMARIMFPDSISTWLRDENGQDVVEYSLLLAFVALVSAALFLYNATSMSQVWTSTTSYLDVGAS